MTRLTPMVVAAAALLVGDLTARPAAAELCYRVKKGAKLYADVTAQTAVGKATNYAEAWPGWSAPSGDFDDTIQVRLVALDGERAVADVDVYVRERDAEAIQCRFELRRDSGDRVELTWPDGRSAGQALTTSIAARRKKAKAQHGRACFTAPLTDASTKVCAPTVEASDEQCVAIASGKQLFARPSNKATLGTTIADVVAEVRLRVGAHLAVTIRDDKRSTRAYVRVADTTPATCPARAGAQTVTLGLGKGKKQTRAAVLPDGTDAGFRVDPPAVDPDAFDPSAHSRECFTHSPVASVRYRICVQY